VLFLRPGNVHSSDGWRAVTEPVIARYWGIAKHLYFRGDAAFANSEQKGSRADEDTLVAASVPDRCLP
jgi:hypothetical protein